mgnify:CR=1 FL=1
MKESLSNRDNYLDKKFPGEGKGDPPKNLEGKVIVYTDENGIKKWILHPDYIDPDNKNLLEKAQKILEESKIWPLH